MYKLKIVFDAQEGCRFDREYYVKKHLELAREQLAGRVGLRHLEAEWNVRPLDRTDVRNAGGSAEVLSPLILSLYLESEEDLDAFLEFLKSPGAARLDQDVANFTDLAPRWTIAELEHFDWDRPS